MRKGKQTDIGKALDSLARGLDRKGHGRLLQAGILPAWEKVAGPMVAEHTAKAHLRGGELMVYVDSPVWATELSALAGPYRDAINEEIGRNVVRSVRFAVSAKVDRERAHRRREAETDAGRAEERVTPVALSEAELAQVRESAATIPDERLREAVLRATVAGMEWEKGRKAAKSRQEPPHGL